MGDLMKARTANGGPDVRSLFAKIDQNSLIYYEFEAIEIDAEVPAPANNLLHRWRSPEAAPAACVSARLDALFARLSARCEA
ncbi:MAG: hypothetical protein ABW063_15930 [Caulobacter sp.]